MLNLRKNTYFYKLIDGISVKICCNYSNLVSKTLSKVLIGFLLGGVASAMPGIYVRVYVYLHRSGFLKGYKLSQLATFMLDRPRFLGITAEQEQVS